MSHSAVVEAADCTHSVSPSLSLYLSCCLTQHFRNRSWLFCTLLCMTVTKVSVCWSLWGWEGLLGSAFTAVGCSAESVTVVCCSAGQVVCVCVCVFMQVNLIPAGFAVRYKLLCAVVQLDPCVCLICECLSRSRAVGLSWQWVRHVCVCVCVLSRLITKGSS